MTFQADAAGVDDGALSVDDAAGLLDAPRRRGEDSQADDDQQDDDEAGPAASAAGDDGGEDGEDEPDADAPAIDAPASWDAEARAHFAQLPREVQDIIHTREQQRDHAITSALQRAADVRKTEQAQNQRYRQALDQLLPQAVETFRGRWDGIDWARWAEADPMACFQAKQRCEQEQAQMQRLRAAQQIGQEAAHADFVQGEMAKLPSLAPDLADPKKGPELGHKLTAFLTSQGVPAGELKWAGASHLAIAYKAYLYDQAQTRGLTPKPPKPAPRPLKPGAGQAGSSKARATELAHNRFAQTRSLADAVALLDARNTS